MSEKESAEWFWGSAGLDYRNPDVITEAEREAFLANFQHTHGKDAPYGPGFWLEQGLPGHLKRYRPIATAHFAGDDRRWYPSVGQLVSYSLSGFEEGLRYNIVQNQVRGDGTGLSKAEALEQVALAFWWVGSRGMASIQRALQGYEWIDPDHPVTMPTGWKAEPSALASGLDFSKEGLTSAERASLESWYLEHEGEVPLDVQFMAKNAPELLKAFRNRFENTLKLLPTQLIPYSMLQVNVMRGYGPGIREGVLLGRGLGLAKSHVIRACLHGTTFGGVDKLALVEAEVGGILDSWT